MKQVMKSIVLAMAVLATTAALSACGPSSKANGSKATAASGGSTITIHNFTFEPATLTVKVGTTVTVKNTDDTDHTVTALEGAFDTMPIHAGRSATFTVTKAGTVKYHCNIHNYMMGSIQVTT